MTEAVREKLVRLLRELFDGRDLSVERRVPHPRIGEREVRADRQIFGHSLREPERRKVLREILKPRARLAARENVELKCVHHLVREYVLEAAIVTGEVEQHPVTQRFRDASHALAQITGDVVLSEIGSRRKEHNRLLFAELVIEDARESRI